MTTEFVVAAGSDAGPVGRYAFLLDAYDTERLKTLAVWSAFSDAEFEYRPEARARTPHEQMVHQCVSEDLWMRTMLGTDVGLSPLPAEESGRAFLRHYAEVTARRLTLLRARTDAWFEEVVPFFDVERPRTWVMVRRLAHSAHHRGQLTAYLRGLGRELYSTYGPTADTGGLFQNGAKVIYRHQSVEALLAAEAADAVRPTLPGPGSSSPTERPNKGRSER